MVNALCILSRMHARRFAAVLLLSLATVARADNTQLTLRVDSHPLKPKRNEVRLGEAKKQKPQRIPMTATFGADFIVVATPDQTTVVDFARRLRFDQPKDQPAIVSSLFAYVGGRDREMENRKYLAGMFASAGAPNPMPLATSEQSLSMLADPPVAGIQSEEKNGVIRFRWKAVQLGEFTTDVLPATESERKAFAQLIRYTYGAHPRILAALVAAAGIPRRLTLIQDFNASEYRMTVEKLEHLPTAPYVAPSSVTHALASDPRFGTAYKAAAALTSDAVQAKAGELASAGDAAIDNNNPLVAFLLYMEAYLMTGTAPPGLSRNASAWNSDPAVSRVRGAIQPKSADEAHQALKVLAEARNQVPDRAQVLHIFEANIHTNLREGAEAYESFRAALTANPAIAGVWHDLGDLFLGHYAANEAWDAWDLARQLAPHHGLLASNEELEKRLLAKYPEFF
jgi:hypothetical protein